MFKMTEKEATKEVLKCIQDPEYFIRSHVMISHQMRGLVKFDLFPFQKDLLNDLQGSQDLSVLKARQLGISTLTAAYILWLTLFHEEKNVLIIATKMVVSRELLDKVKSMYKNLPLFFQKYMPIGGRNNTTELTFANGSRILASTTSSDAGRSFALSLLVIDEAAHVDNLGELMTAVQPTLSTGGRFISLSTPNGQGNWFHENHMAAVNGVNDCKAIELPWTVHPERDDEWFEAQCKSLLYNEPKIAQEHLCSFNASGRTVIDPKRLTEISEGSDKRDSEVREPMYKTGPVYDSHKGGQIWVWEDVEFTRSYLITADVARGDGEDFSAFQVFDMTMGAQVAEAQVKEGGVEFAALLVDWANKYNRCPILVESNNIGHAVCTEILRLNYPLLMYTRTGDGTIHPRYMAEGRGGYKVGMYMSHTSRPQVLEKFSEYVHMGTVKIRSSRLVAEMRRFIWHNNKQQAANGANDDLTMAFAIGCFAIDQLSYKNKHERRSVEASVRNIRKVSRTRATADDVRGVSNVAFGGIVFSRHGRSRGRTSTISADEIRKNKWLL